MKFWKGLTGTSKAGRFGSMDDDGYVPDSVEIPEQEYLDWVASLPVVSEIDHKNEFSKLLSADEKINYIAKQLKLA